MGEHDREQPIPRHLWRNAAPGKFMGKGHPVGDYLEAYEWDVLEERRDHLRLLARLPRQVRNPRGSLFGGYAPTYVDLVAVHTYRAGRRHAGAGPVRWLATVNMRVDFLEPVVEDRFEIVSDVVNRRGRTALVQTRFLDSQGRMLLHALTVLREVG